MAIQMIKHTLTPGWAKVASGAYAVLLQGYSRTFMVAFSDTPPAPDSTGIMTAPGEQDLSVSGLPGTDVYVRAVSEWSAGNLITGMVGN